jgi:outer membrane protein TolC
VLLIAATLSAAGGPARAEAPPALGDQPALSDYLDYAERNNPGLQAAYATWRAALERVPQARAFPDPRVTYQYYFEPVETRVGPQRWSLGISQMLPFLGKRGLRGDAASEAAEAARERYEAEKLRVAYRVKDAYHEYVYLARGLEILRENLKLMEYFESVARTLYEVGSSKHADVIRAQVELGKLEDRLRTMEDLRGPIVARLNAALNRPLDEPLPWPNPVATPVPQIADERVYELLRAANPELRAREHEVRREEFAADLAGKDYFPDLTLGLNYIATDHARMSGVRGSGDDPVIGSVSINIPIWYGKYAAGVREAERRRDAAARMREETRNRLSTDARLVLYRLDDAARKVDLYGNTLVPKGRESIEATETSYRAGKATFLELVDSERVLLEFQLARERALADQAQRLAELEMTVGRPLTEPESAGPAAQVWTCPMHPQVQQDQPGTCPICGMDLVPRVPASNVEPSENTP